MSISTQRGSCGRLSRPSRPASYPRPVGQLRHPMPASGSKVTEQVGDTVNTSLVFSNTGSIAITGTAIIEVQTTDGASTIETFNHTVANLAPGSAVTLNDVWDTTGATGDEYRVIGYVLYESKSTAVEEVTIGTQMRVYLPVVLRNTGQ